MNILYQNNEIKHECHCRNKEYYPLGEKFLSPNLVYNGKITSSQTNCNEKVYFWVAEKSFKDSTTTSNPFPMKITQTIQKCRTYTEKSKRTTSFQNSRGVSKENVYHIN